MRERNIFIYITSLVGVALSFIQSGGALIALGGSDTTIGDILSASGITGAPLARVVFLPAEIPEPVQIIIVLLAAIVFVSITLLFNQIVKYAAARVTTIIALIITAIAVGPASLPMLVIAAFSVLATTGLKWTKVAGISSLCGAIWLCLFLPGGMIIITASLLLGFSVYIYREMEKVEKSEKVAEDRASETEEIQEMLWDQRRMVKTTEHVSRLEERNRLAARIHDEIGHGMSGSVLLLEGALLVMDSDPEKARDTIQKVTENLRESVEEIRKVLREERSASADVNLARIENELTSFSANHPMIKTGFETDGDMSDVNGAVWICVYENMVEALTNMLKHSSATLFNVNIKNNAGLLLVEFSDNGGAAAAGKDIKPGIGLQNMEERAALCYGRCFFRHEPDGFHILMTFPRKGDL